MTNSTRNLAGLAAETLGTEDRNAGAADDVELLERVRAGDQRACEALVRWHGERMLAVTRQALRQALRTLLEPVVLGEVGQ
jgi:hypothetical protein